MSIEFQNPKFFLTTSLIPSTMFAIKKLPVLDVNLILNVSIFLVAFEIPSSNISVKIFNNGTLSFHNQPSLKKHYW